jgi:acylphosphatase
MKTVRLSIFGLVQGVGYRGWAVTTARRLGVSGWVRNRFDGSVEALVASGDSAVEAMIAACRRGPSHAAVESVEVTPTEEGDAGEEFGRRATG